MARLNARCPSTATNGERNEQSFDRRSIPKADRHSGAADSMKWTIKLPTVPGFYYWHGDGMTEFQVCIVQIRSYGGSDMLKADELQLSKGSIRKPRHGFPIDFGGQWAGPMPPPI